MGFWTFQINSIRKAFELRRISRVLGQFGGPFDAVAILTAAEKQRMAEEALFDLVEKDEMLSRILQAHGASRNDMRNLYDALAIIVGEWRRGHWVLASALAFGIPLDYLLRKCVSGNETTKQKNEAIQ